MRSFVLFLFVPMNRDPKQRTKEFAVRVINLYARLPKSAVGAQYRESQYAKYDADLISKLEGSLQNSKKLNTGPN